MNDKYSKEEFENYFIQLRWRIPIFIIIAFNSEQISEKSEIKFLHKKMNWKFVLLNDGISVLNTLKPEYCRHFTHDAIVNLSQKIVFVYFIQISTVSQITKMSVNKLVRVITMTS